MNALIEDSLVQAKRLEHFFNEFKINYRLFNNAEDAYSMVLKEAPELIISDIVMPGMDGYEFCLKIKSIRSLSKIPIILLTSLQDSHDIIKGLQAGESTKEYMEIIIQSAWSMSKLINDLLQFSRLGLVAIECEPVDLSKIASEVMANILKQDPSRNVKVSIEGNLSATADPKMLEIVLNNLLGNAFKYTTFKSDAEISFGKKDYYGKDLFKGFILIQNMPELGSA